MLPSDSIHLNQWSDGNINAKYIQRIWKQTHSMTYKSKLTNERESQKSFVVNVWMALVNGAFKGIIKRCTLKGSIAMK